LAVERKIKRTPFSARSYAQNCLALDTNSTESKIDYICSQGCPTPQSGMAVVNFTRFFTKLAS
jgi:hypothetical protein